MQRRLRFARQTQSFAQIEHGLAAYRKPDVAAGFLAQRIERGDALLVEAKVRIAALRASDFRPRPIPDPLLAELKPLVETT